MDNVHDLHPVQVLSFIYKVLFLCGYHIIQPVQAATIYDQEDNTYLEPLLQSFATTFNYLGDQLTSQFKMSL
jgi:hypothetical protein